MDDHSLHQSCSYELYLVFNLFEMYLRVLKICCLISNLYYYIQQLQQKEPNSYAFVLLLRSKKIQLCRMESELLLTRACSL